MVATLANKLHFVHFVMTAQRAVIQMDKIEIRGSERLGCGTRALFEVVARAREPERSM